MCVCSMLSKPGAECKNDKKPQGYQQFVKNPGTIYENLDRPFIYTCDIRNRMSNIRGYIVKI